MGIAACTGVWNTTSVLFGPSSAGGVQWMLAGSLAHVPAGMPLKDLSAPKSDTLLQNIACEPEMTLALLDVINALLENFKNDSVETDSIICDA
ncbi:MAG TPA: hypothetical protein VFA76_01885 [Terriglobales bacterium]|nr:hypothetical protein [Terriglobales bacterium]